MVSRFRKNEFASGVRADKLQQRRARDWPAYCFVRDRACRTQRVSSGASRCL